MTSMFYTERADRLSAVAEARFDHLDAHGEEDAWAQEMQQIMASAEWLEEERPTTCENCGKPLKGAQAPHRICGMAICCPDCICTGQCDCPTHQS
jgi:hypothetical protein